MINVGIAGGAAPCAGELLRILVNHPDVTICCVHDASLTGCDLTSAHHGLIGESQLEFAPDLKLEKLDVLFIASQGFDYDRLVQFPDLKVVDIASEFADARKRDSLVVYGVPELNRKSLVRGAVHAVIPSALESVATIALQPLAMRQMLPEAFTLTLQGAQEIISAQPTELGEMVERLTASGVKSFHIDVKREAEDLGRVLRIALDIDLPVPIDNITDMYEELYDDHNLTFIVGEEVAPREVEGTDKCIVSLDKSPEGKLQLRALADAYMRGGAGDAVHVMNLFMGLYEKTGLTLKASRY